MDQITINFRGYELECEYDTEPAGEVTTTQGEWTRTDEISGPSLNLYGVKLGELYLDELLSECWDEIKDRIIEELRRNGE